MYSKNDYIILHTNCILVIGAKYSIIQDNLRRKVHRVPEIIGKFLLHFNRQKIQDAYQEFTHKDIKEMIQYLLKEEFIQLANNVYDFPELNLNFETPELINNAIIEVSQSLSEYYPDIVKDLTILGCKHLELRWFNPTTLVKLKQVIDLFCNSRIRSIDIYLVYSEEIDINEINNLLHHYSIINLFVYNSLPKIFIKELQNDKYKFYRNLVITHEEVKNSKLCGLISKFYFSINQETYLQAINYNSCLYKKISIDISGNIKICPSLNEVYGSILQSSLVEVVSSIKDNKYWNITKKQIDVCKSCEYRMVCTDCRAYIENPEDIYSKPLKCGYNPYSGEWSEWSTNPLKQKAIEYYGLNEFLVTEQKI